MTINFDDFKVRCSAIDKVLSESQSNPTLTEKQEEKLAELEDKLQKKGFLTENQQEELAKLRTKEENGTKIILSDTCIEYLLTDYSWITEGMIPIGKESLDTVGMRKGKLVEKDSVALLTELDKATYKIHKDRINNDYLSGEIDTYLGDNVYSAFNITDIKNSTDHPTFLKKIKSKLDKSHKRQVQGYMDITGAKYGCVAHTLVNNPDDIIEDMRWKVSRMMGFATPEAPEFVRDEWPKWERSMRFDHMPIHKRVYKMNIEPMTDFERQKLHDRVKICREWLNDFHEQYQKLNLKSVTF